MHTLRTLRTALMFVFALLLSACAGDAESSWSDLRCYDDEGAITCVGEVDGESVLLVPTATVLERLDAGLWWAPEPSECAPAGWDAVTCVETVAGLGCLGEIEGVVVPAADPCAPAPEYPLVDVRGLLAVPAPADSELVGDLVAWPG